MQNSAQKNHEATNDIYCFIHSKFSLLSLASRQYISININIADKVASSLEESGKDQR